MRPLRRPVRSACLFGFVVWTMMIAVPAAGAEGLFEQVNIGPVSIGGRATYDDPKDASGEWYGGGWRRVVLFDGQGAGEL